MKVKGSGRRCGAPWLLVVCLLATANTYGQENRKLVARPAPAYPGVAKNARLEGTVKVQVVIAPDGRIKDVKVIGGHPLFVETTLEALKNWKYAPSNAETTAVLEFNFHP